MKLSYCGETVRKHDPDRFLLSLFAPADRREALWALYAFNFEIARTREVVSETQLGLIRLQWWRDALQNPPAGNPVLDALVKLNLPRESLESLIYAREFDLEDRAPPDLAGLVKYAEFTSVPLMYLSHVILSAAKYLGSICKGEDPSASPQDDKTKNIAIAYALTGLLRATPAHLRQHRCLLPENLIPSVQDLYAGQGLEKLDVAVEAVAEKAESLLSHSDDKFTNLHAHLAHMYLNQIKSAGYDLFSPRLKIPPFARELRLWWGNLF